MTVTVKHPQYFLVRSKRRRTAGFPLDQRADSTFPGWLDNVCGTCTGVVAGGWVLRLRGEEEGGGGVEWEGRLWLLVVPVLATGAGCLAFSVWDGVAYADGCADCADGVCVALCAG